MLDYRRDRLDYGERLIPPQGYRLDRAVGTTYSADLNTLLSIPVALVYAQTLEGKLDAERFQILDAIKSIATMVTVYHQKGQLHVPAKYNRLYAFLEDMLAPVYPATAFTSFHPKTWVLRYVHEEDEQPAVCRVLVLSRNLTFDRSWDVAACLDGVEGEDRQERSRPLVDFLRHLNGIHPFPGATAFIRGVGRTKFNAPDGFRRLSFHPVGIPRYYTSPIHSATGDRAAVISPFVDAKGIQKVTGNVTGDVHLFSRQEELTKVDADVLSECSGCYAISRWIVEGERQMELEGGGDADIREQDLHAKVYVFENDGRLQWFLGSANVTGAALFRNTEFMVGFVEKSRKAGVDGLLNELLGEDRDLGVFEEFDATQGTGADPDAPARDALRQIEYALLDAPVEATVTQAPNQVNYDLAVRVDLHDMQLHCDLKISVRPLNVATEPRKIKAGEVNEITFDNIQETELTRFLVYRLDSGPENNRQFLVKIDVKGLPESRHDSIFKSIVNSQEKFFQYLCFLLSEEHRKEDVVGGDEHEGKGNGNGEEQWHVEVPVFEQLLVAASRDPRKLKHIDDLIERLSHETKDGQIIVPPAFLDFWDVFRPLIPKDKRGR